MYLLGLEIKKDRREKKMVTISCSRCGRVYVIAKGNLRVMNYCEQC